jgi:hypothetical protein
VEQKERGAPAWEKPVRDEVAPPPLLRILPRRGRSSR